MNIIKASFTMCIIVIVAITALFVDFAYKTFSYRQSSEKVDAIVVLTGGKGRVDEGVRLFRELRGEYLFLIGVDPSVKKSDLYHPKLGDPSEENVIIENKSRNTLENAILGRDVIMSKGVHSILLVTSRYHLKRASILFRNSLPDGVKIIPYPINTGNLKESWWNHSSSFNILFKEFYKYCLLRVLL